MELEFLINIALRRDFMHLSALVGSAVILATLSGTALSAQTVGSLPPTESSSQGAMTKLSASSLAVPGGTPLDISLTQQVASNTAHAGDKLRFQADEAVAIDGWVVIEKGALGEAEVTSVEAAAGNGHPGKMAIQFDWIYASDGLKVKLSDVPEKSDGEAAKGSASTATIASYVVLGPLGLFAHNFVHGKDIIITPDRKIKAYVAQTVHVVPKVQVSSADGFAH